MADKSFVKCKVSQVTIKDAIRVTLIAEPPNEQRFTIEVKDPDTFETGAEVIAVIQDGQLIDLWKRP